MTEDGRLDLEDLKRMKTTMISNTMAAEVLRMDQGKLADYARDGQLPWKVLAPKQKGSHVYHNREDFIRHWTGEEPEAPQRTTDDLLMELIEVVRVQNTMIMELVANTKTASCCNS